MGFLKKNRYIILLRIALGISIVAIGYLTTMFYYQVRDLDSSFESIENANAVQDELMNLLLVINDNEIKLSGFVITEDVELLQENFNNKKRVRKYVENLKKNSLQREYLEIKVKDLEKLIENKYLLFDKIILLIKNKPYDKPLLEALILKSKILNERIEYFLNDTVRFEIDKVKKYNKDYQEKIANCRNTVLILALLSVFIFLLSYSRMNDNILMLKKMNDDLKFLNETFNNAEVIAGFGSWKINLHTNTYTYSDNFFRLLGAEPQSFDPTLENISKYIHPDDVEYAIKTHQDSLAKQIPTSIIYRYVLPSGELKYIISIGNFTTNSEGETVKIGVNHDVTEHFKNTAELEEKNKRLTAINAELESFNNIVSHDLQEPLRKIQMFISRIESNDFGNISEQGKGYFNKIKVSANRMQNLMVDLVNYSRTIKGTKVFENVDLNDVLNEIIDELSITIEETNTTIRVGKLPVILGTQFQIQQLFMNIINNSLKYIQKGKTPEINIFSEDFFVDNSLDNNNNNNPQEGKVITNKDYFKIVISDNGIGFDQEYSQKIFQLFRRLETELTYEGTGLGLAICKKIVENHDGFIKAEGVLDVGAKFIIYFPKAKE